MTNEKAKELLIHVLMTYEPRDQYGDWDDSEPYEEAITMAIKALQANTDGDTISRQAAIDVAKDVHNAVLCCEVSPSKSLLEVVKRLESLPTAEPKREECEEREQGLCPFYAG